MSRNTIYGMSPDTYTRVYFSTLAAIVLLVAGLLAGLGIWHHHTRVSENRDREQFVKDLTHSMVCDDQGWSPLMCKLTADR